jgi:hypothetical protein
MLDVKILRSESLYDQKILSRGRKWAQNAIMANSVGKRASFTPKYGEKMCKIKDDECQFGMLITKTVFKNVFQTI